MRPPFRFPPPLPSPRAFSGRVLRTEKLLERQLSSSVPSSRRFVLSPLGKRKNASSIMPSLDYPTGGMCSRGIQLPRGNSLVPFLLSSILLSFFSLPPFFYPSPFVIRPIRYSRIKPNYPRREQAPFIYRPTIAKSLRRVSRISRFRSRFPTRFFVSSSFFFFIYNRFGRSVVRSVVYAHIYSGNAQLYRTKRRL